MNIRSVVRSGAAPAARAAGRLLPVDGAARSARARHDRSRAGRQLVVRRSQGRDEPRRRHLGPIDRHRYEIEWREEPDHVTRYRAYATPVGKEALLNVEEVGPTRTDPRFVFLRARPAAGGGLSIAVVQEDALKGTDRPGRDRRDHQARRRSTLYGPFATCTATVPRP